ncbi:sigma-54 interaction domain-containing protein, partial [Planctomycetota bacterium]
SGTGKELVAGAIHDLSSRSDRSFVCVNCGAVPDTLLESELFGYVRGAFTGATKNKPGRFQQADKGTLFLDEVGDLSAAFQVKLLRALQEGEVQPLGSTQSLHVDVRIIAATNRDLRRLIEKGQFREDLYYRLCVFPIHVPPLKERREDIIPLAEYHMSRLSARTGKAIRSISPAALTALCEHAFPGNVRELVNILERAFVLCRGEQIEVAHLPPDVTAPHTPRPLGQLEYREPAPPPSIPKDAAAIDQPADDQSSGAWFRHLKPSEHRMLSLPKNGTDPHPGDRRSPAPLGPARPEVRRLVEILNANGWNRGATADALGISRSTLWRRMKEYGLL